LESVTLSLRFTVERLASIYLHLRLAHLAALPFLLHPTTKPISLPTFNHFLFETYAARRKGNKTASFVARSSFVLWYLDLVSDVFFVGVVRSDHFPSCNPHLNSPPSLLSTSVPPYTTPKLFVTQNGLLLHIAAHTLVPRSRFHRGGFFFAFGFGRGALLVFLLG
jgi:hypothetical protein